MDFIHYEITDQEQKQTHILPLLEAWRQFYICSLDKAYIILEDKCCNTYIVTSSDEIVQNCRLGCLPTHLDQRFSPLVSAELCSVTLITFSALTHSVMEPLD